MKMKYLEYCLASDLDKVLMIKQKLFVKNQGFMDEFNKIS